MVSRMTSSNIRHIAVMSLLLLSSCGGGSGGSDEVSSVDSSAGVVSGSDSSGLRTGCGVISNRSLFNPVSESRGVEITIRSVLDSNSFVVFDGSSEFVVKLQGLGGTVGFNNTAARGLFMELASEKLFFFSAGACEAEVIGGSLAQVGSIVTQRGVSFAEEVIRRKFAGVIETSGECGEDAISGCFQSISNSNSVRAFGPSIPCSAMPAHTSYNPADSRCNGNASVTVNNSLFGSVFSIQLRYPDGTDRIIQACADADCTPLKVQRYIRGGGTIVGCFGAPGAAVSLADINHTSVKREGTDSTPPRYCIPDPSQRVN
jgi:hypothetical protein